MIRLFQTCTDDPYINLALEAKLFRERQETVFLWQNRPSVIAGRNQNLYAEADLDYAQAHHISAVRRTTGGGCVYHDRGNLNYSMILPGARLDSAPQMIVKILSAAGVCAESSGRNDLLVKGRKCGGTAWQIEDEWVLFHGTVLIDTDLETMRQVLTPAKLKLESKGIASVRSRVINLSEADPDITAETLKAAFERYCECRAESIGPDDSVLKEASVLSSPRWIYGECSDYQISHDFRTGGGIVRVLLSVHDGLIEDVQFSHDCIDTSVSFRTDALKGMFYSPQKICDKICALIKEESGNV